MATDTAEELTFDEAEKLLEMEWRDANPQRVGEVYAFYRDSMEQGAQLNAWHRDTARGNWTAVFVDVARRSGPDGGMARVAVDIGAGMGHDLSALREAGVTDVIGVEPNVEQRRYMMQTRNIFTVESVQYLPETVYPNGEPCKLWDGVDLILCLDVLEHIPYPDLFLEQWCSKARIGAMLIERTAVYDVSTPLHTNRGWHPGHMLDSYGWALIEQDRATGVGIWKRIAESAPKTRTGIVQVLGSGPNPANYRGMLEWVAKGNRLPLVVTGDSLVPRARSMAFSHWWRETADDVVVMIDSDIGFTTEDVERLTYWCRRGHEVICAAFPMHDGKAFGMQVFDSEDNPIKFGNNMEPKKIRSVAPGFLAVHRHVLDMLIPTLPLCHASLATSFWPMCMDFIETVEQTSLYTGLPLEPIHTMLSEDWAFSARLRALGIDQWVARDIIVEHWGPVAATIRNMNMVQQAVANA